MPRKFKIKIFLLLGITFFAYFIFKPVTWWSVIFGNDLRETNDLTNVLILGIAGGNHAGASLTDTMILTAIDQKTNKVTLISLPRDIWSTGLQDKINSAYEFGEKKQKGNGFILAKTLVSDITGLPVHYAAKINLSGLKEIVDILGGVEVYVDESFDDYKFPIDGKENDLCSGDPEYKCRFLHVHFDKGPQFLNGEKAMQFIRSRQAEGDEGTDFARNRRQQKVILALKNKILSPSVFLNPTKWIPLYFAFEKTIDTDIPQNRLPYFWKTLASGLKNVKTLEIDQLLVNPPQTKEYKNLWVLIPKSGDFSEIQNFLKKEIRN